MHRDAIFIHWQYLLIIKFPNLILLSFIKDILVRCNFKIFNRKAYSILSCCVFDFCCVYVRSMVLFFAAPFLYNGKLWTDLPGTRLAPIISIYIFNVVVFIWIYVYSIQPSINASRTISPHLKAALSQNKHKTRHNTIH